LPAGARAGRRDTLSLGWQDRLKARGRWRSDGGFEFGTALPRGAVLRHGECLVFAEQEIVVQVVALAEPVFVVTPASPAEWGLFAYHIGNSHQPLMLTDEAILCPDVPGMAQVLAYHRIPYAPESRVFTPVGQVPGHQHQP
jgi:urease accessory protein UreE